MPADREPPLAAFSSAIEKHVGNCCAALSSCPEAGKHRVPRDTAGPERANLPQSKPLLRRQGTPSLCLRTLAS